MKASFDHQWRRVAALRAPALLAILIALGGSSSANEVLVYGKLRTVEGRQPLVGGTVQLENGEGLAIDRFVTQDSADYSFQLYLDQLYHLRYTAPGRFPKWLVIDTRNIHVSPEERAGGWGMNVDVTLVAKFPGVSAELLAEPFGIATWSAQDSMFVWDLDHTERVRGLWDAVIAANSSVGGEVASAMDPVEDPPPSWMLLAVLIAIGVIGRWLVPLAFAKTSNRPGAGGTLVVVLLFLAMLSSGLGWATWSDEGWKHIWSVGFGALGAVLLLATLWYHGTALEAWFPDREIVLPEERSRGQRILGTFRNIGGILLGGSGFLLFFTMERIVHPEVLLQRGLFAVPLAFLLFLLILSWPVKRWFKARADRASFWMALFAVLLVLTPALVQVIDRALVGAEQDLQLVEIIGLNTSSRKGSISYHAEVLMNGKVKDLHVSEQEYAELDYADAMELTVQRGPFGIEHITGQTPVYRVSEDIEDVVEEEELAADQTDTIMVDTE